MNKIINFFKHFYVIPTDLNGGWKFQLNIPIGRNPNKPKKDKKKKNKES